MRISRKTISNLFSAAILVNMCMILLFNPYVFAQTLSPADLNSIYNDTVWYAPSSDNPVCSGAGAVTAGSGAPDGAAFPNLDPTAMANAINTWIIQQNPSSELKGLGETIVAGAKNSNINPFLILAIAHEESSLSTPSDWNVQHANNSFGRTAASGQPSIQGAKLWYKWTSVEASVDNTAPENQNAPGGGDIASYIRNEYGSQLDNNNLLAMITQYAPPVENDTAQYISNVQSWVSQLVNLTAGGASAPSTSSFAGVATTGCSGSTTNCTSGNSTATGVNAAILCEANKYNGIYYLFGGGHEAYSTFRQQCPEEAISGAAASSTPTSPGPCSTDCSGLVSVAVDGAYGQNFTWSVSTNDGSIVGSGSQYWQEIPISQAQAGDILTRPDHVEIVDHVQGGTAYTFGSHETGKQTGLVAVSTSYWSSAYRWTGPGSNG